MIDSSRAISPDATEPGAATDGGKTGILLVNLGTPDAATAPAVRRYLREFLSDRRVIDLPRLIWLPILYLLVLVFRPRKVARNYARIWSESGSPLLTGTEALAAAMRKQRPGVPVAVGMRYGNPSIEQALRELTRAGAARIVVLPLYPQFSHTTTSSVDDALVGARQRVPGVTHIDRVADYHRHPAYIRALAGSIRRWWQTRGRGEQLLMSFHGIPRRYAEAGDPYPQQCEASARALAEELGLEDGQWAMVYQSRFGKAEWLRPYADEHLRRMAEHGARRLDIVCPGFPVDCLETLEEVAIGLDELFREAGGEALRYIPALGDDPAQADLMWQLADSAGHGVSRPAGDAGSVVAE